VEEIQGEVHHEKDEEKNVDSKDETTNEKPTEVIKIYQFFGGKFWYDLF
jgi:hypothetical protein